jgi:Cu-processing system permease protein
MNGLFGLLKYEFLNVLRARWLFFYGAGFFVFTLSVLQFGGNGDKAVASLLNFVLLLVPMVSILYSSMYWYNSESFTVMLLTQPLRRSHVLLASWSAVFLALAGSFALGTGLALAFSHQIGLSTGLLVITGVALTAIYAGLGTLIAVCMVDRMKGIGVTFLVWLYFAVLHDALIFGVVSLFRDYPVEIPALTLLSLNPADLARMSLLLSLDLSAMMGYTGRILQTLLSKPVGLIAVIVLLIIWLAVPLFVAVKVFKKKDI